MDESEPRKKISDFMKRFFLSVHYPFNYSVNQFNQTARYIMRGKSFCVRGVVFSFTIAALYVGCREGDIKTIEPADSNDQPRLLSAPKLSHPAPNHRNLWTMGKTPTTRERFEPGIVLVKFRKTLERSRLEATVAQLGLRRIQPTSSVGVERLALAGNPRETVPEAARRISAHPQVVYAEPNYEIGLLAEPNDPLYGELWGMNNTGQTGGTADADIDALEAWGIAVGSRDVIVAVLDTGVDYNHPDLKDNMWINQDEIEGNGIDDDNNGYVDDVRGWNFENETNDPADWYGHGTHCAGTIGAVGNNSVGVAGVNWRVSIMPLMIIGNQDKPTFCLDAAEGIKYAVDNGAHIMSCSWWTIQHYSETLEDAVVYADQQGVILVAAAGNDNRDDDDPNYHHWPSEWPYDNIIAVAATNHNDGRAYFSNWGLTTVDVGAPGMDILSTSMGGGYELGSGTSMATPHVAGAVALIKSIRPELSVAEIRNFLFTTIDPIPDLQGLTVTGGRINVHKMLQAASGVPLPPVALAGGDQLAVTGDQITLDGSNSFDPNQDPLTFQWEFYPPAASGAKLSDTTGVAPTFIADVCGRYQAFLTVEDDGGLVSEPDRARVHVMNLTEQSPPIETDHPYDNNEDRTWTVNIPGALVVGVHFSAFVTEGGYDFVRIMNAEDEVVAIYDGDLGAFNSMAVEGDTLKIRFTSDYSVTKEGFIIDNVWWCDVSSCPIGLADCDDDPRTGQGGCETGTSDDMLNCGGCGQVCDLPNASETCVAGVCEIVDCEAGWTDCDGDPENGCETDLLIDPINCGQCANICGPYPNATAGCVEGICAIGACESGWDDCNGDIADGCEQNTATEVDHCGACGNVCSFPQVEHAYCEMGVCMLGDCQVEPRQIETPHPYENNMHLEWSIHHPGASSVQVHFALFEVESGWDYVYLYDQDDNLVATYTGIKDPFVSAPIPGDTVRVVFESDVIIAYDGFVIDWSKGCIGTGCMFGWGDCDGVVENGCEADLSSDVNNCGACDDPCVFQHATGACMGFVCEVHSCDEHWGDCNAQGRDGCETGLADDPVNCGGCSVVCGPFDHATPGCMGGGCILSACDPGWDDCDMTIETGCETHLISDVSNCGACGEFCGAPNMNNQCNDGICQPGDVCLSGFEDCDADLGNGCEADLSSDPENCATCGVACRYDNAMGVCQAGACSMGICYDGYDDCNQDDVDGCEINLGNDADNCNGCGNVCSFPNVEHVYCEGGQCAMGDCQVVTECLETTHPYDNDTDLEWVISHPGAAQMQVHFDLFELEDSEACESDYVRLYAGDDQLVATYCGAKMPFWSDPVTGDTVRVVFHSNSSESRLGLIIDWYKACMGPGCSFGWEDCDGAAENGCEIDVLSDNENCGACGLDCDVPHAKDVSCTDGVCVIQACEDGWGMCDADERNGCETYLFMDNDNCGACGNVCVFPNAFGACLFGGCMMIECMEGFADCNHNASDGCEVGLLDDPNHCGACGNVCRYDNAAGLCVQGQCQIEACIAGYEDCNQDPTDGCEVDLSADADHCGACDVVCELAHASSECEQGECRIAACNETHQDCNQQAQDGCEVNTDTDPNNCGACDEVCDFLNAAARCLDGVCSFESCDPGFHDCDADLTNGCEVQSDDGCPDDPHIDCDGCGTNGQPNGMLMIWLGSVGLLVLSRRRNVR